MNKSYLKNSGRRPANPQLAELLHSMEPGDTIRILGNESAEVRRMVGSLNRTIKRKGVCLSYRKGSGNRNYVTCIRNVHPRTYIYKDMAPTWSRPVSVTEDDKEAFLKRMQKMMRRLGVDITW
jgi:hypothetical protein